MLTTHYMDEAERLCNHVAIIDHGHIVAMDTPAKLIRSMGGEERLLFKVDKPLPAQIVDEINQLGKLETRGEMVVVHGSTSQANLVSHVVAILAKENIQYSDVRTEQASLEDVFLKLTGKELRE